MPSEFKERAMTVIRRLAALSFLLLGFGVLGAAKAQAANLTVMDATARCQALKGGRWADIPSAPTWVISATYHAATAERRAYCDVEGYVNPTVNFGIWLPSQDWNRRYIVRGCGGSCGVVAMEIACAKHLRDGYACVHTDMGHRSDQIDNNWAANNLQGLVDFGYRATHVVTVAGKAIVTAFYNGPPRWSYFYGCSTGGRQAMVEAERFPDDFNGIVAVAPVDIGPFGSSNYVPPGSMNADTQGHQILTDLDIPMIYRAVMKACDLKDGVADGLFAPSDCAFDPGVLLCKPGSAAAPHTCLNAEQVDLVRRFHGKGAQPGSELNWFGNLSRAPGPQTQFAQPRGDPVIAETLNNAGDPDLRAFNAHGGKLILAHGTTDLIVLPGQTIDYYETATRVMGGPQNTTGFFRFFLIPGMDHCSGGDGAWSVDYLTPLTRWVEQGHAPDKVIGVHPKLGAQFDYFGLDTDKFQPGEIAFSRPHFPYPLKAYYDGKGDPNLASSFTAALHPLGKIALSVQVSSSEGDRASASDLTALIVATEKAYVASGLPAQNVTDRIAKALRRRIYLSDQSRSKTVSILTRMLAADPSPIAKPAIQSVLAEFD
jgi:pimeloyl-ACP methyl ester carboxylesterase